MSLCFDSLHCAEDPAAKWIRSPRPKQETGERTRGRLMFRARIQIVSRCASANQERGVCVFVCVCNSCEVVSFKTGKRHTHAFTHKHTHRRRHTGSIVAPSVCLWRCSLRVLVIATSTPKQKAGWLFSGPASSTHPIAHRYYTPLQLAVKLGPFTTLEASEDTKKCTHGRLGIAGCCV